MYRKTRPISSMEGGMGEERGGNLLCLTSVGKRGCVCIRAEF